MPPPTRFSVPASLEVTRCPAVYTRLHTALHTAFYGLQTVLCVFIGLPRVDVAHLEAREPLSPLDGGG